MTTTTAEVETKKFRILRLTDRLYWNLLYDGNIFERRQLYNEKMRLTREVRRGKPF